MNSAPKFVTNFAIGSFAVLALAGAALAGDDDIKAIVSSITDRNPQTHVAKVDQERLAVHRIDIVDSKGVIRMTLAGDLPEPIVDGLAYKRSRPTGGIILRDGNGNERGGIAFTPGFGAVIGLDHANGEAAGFNVQENGTVNFVMQAKPKVLRPEGAGGHVIPEEGVTPIAMQIAPDGTPRVELHDQQDRPRLVFTVTKEGYGAIQFLDADGKVVEALDPEKDAGK